MTLDQALQNLAFACSKFIGNLEQHNAMQQSLIVIKAELAKVPPTPEAPPTTP